MAKSLRNDAGDYLVIWKRVNGQRKQYRDIYEAGRVLPVLTAVHARRREWAIVMICIGAFHGTTRYYCGIGRSTAASQIPIASFTAFSMTACRTESRASTDNP